MTVYNCFKDIPWLHYNVVYADPPWEYKTWSKKGAGRSPERHYPTMPLEDIEQFKVADIAAPNSVCFMWITGTLLGTPRHKHLVDPPLGHRAVMEYEAIHMALMDYWAFECRALAFVWIKTNKNFTGDSFTEKDLFRYKGKYTSQNAEFCFVGVRGKPGLPVESMVPQVIVSPVQEHSRKPEEVRNRIRRMYPGPRIELFSREDSKGFDAFGNETGKFNGVSHDENR